MTRSEFLAVVSAPRGQAAFDAKTVEAIERAFPNVDPGVLPFGQRVIVQIRLSRRITDTGIVLAGETQDTEKWNTAVAQLIAVGPLAFKKRDSLEPWGEGVWAQVGDFLRVPRFGGDRWEVGTDDVEAKAAWERQAATMEAKLGNERDEERRYKLQQEIERLRGDPPLLMVQFAMFNDHELNGQITGDPVAMRTYV